MIKKILVTGSEGFIGSHLVEFLVEKKYQINALCLYNSFDQNGWLDFLDPKIKKKINLIKGDIRDFKVINSAIEGCQCVIHLASLIAIPYSYDAPSSYVKTNIDGTFGLGLGLRLRLGLGLGLRI